MKLFYNVFSRPLDGFVKHAESNERLKHNLPFQVQCCWNGAVVIDARPFNLPARIRFRREFTRLASERQTDALYSQCSASECNQLCNDLQRNGFKRAMVVPRVKLAYEWQIYMQLHADDSLLSPNQSESGLVEFTEPPTKIWCEPLNNVGSRSPDGPGGYHQIL
jgi:hypothetical protein